MLNAFDIEDTIAAIATAREPGAVRGIIRVSGSIALRAVGESFRATGELSIDELKSPTVASGGFKSDAMQSMIPCEIAVWPNQRSYTNQVSVEIHTIGSLPILDAILEQLLKSGCRLAEPGEFTMRAFLSGRLDLTEAEAVLGVIDADDKSQLNVALEQLSGGLAKPLEQVRTQLIESLAHLEAGLDFVEEDIEFISNDELVGRLRQIKDVVEGVGRQLSNRQDSNSLPEVVLYGSPNAGKSSLFNALVSFGQEAIGQEAMAGRPSSMIDGAIVSEISGTTRDYISAELTINDFRCQLLDTAGVEVEQSRPVGTGSIGIDSAAIETASESNSLGIGQSLSKRLHDRAKLELFCIDSTREMLPWEAEYLEQRQKNRIVCLTKCDQPSGKIWSDEPQRDLVESAVQTSSEKQLGMEQLRAAIADFFSEDESSEAVLGTSVRCSASIAAILDSLSTAMDLAVNQYGDEFIAAELRTALHEIGRVTGVVYTDDILDVVFSQFCIGK